MKALAAHASRRHFKRGEQIFAEGDRCTGLFIVATGRVRIFKLSRAGREQVLAVEGPGSSFAELPVFDGGDYPASAMAMQDTEMFVISRSDFQSFCRSHPEVTLKVLEVVGARLRRLVGIIEELSFTTVRQRLIALLLRLSESDGRPSKQGITFVLRMSHQDLAAELGTVRELVSRNLGRLQAEGLLEMDGRRIILKNIAALKNEQDLPQ